MAERFRETVFSIRLPPSIGSMRVVKNENNVHQDHAAYLLGLRQILYGASTKGFESHVLRLVRSSPRVGEPMVLVNVLVFDDPHRSYGRR